MPGPADRLHELVERLGRLAGAEAREGGVTPSQRAALAYLGRANAFSRTPSAVADYLGTTRGTVSQTLLALEARGLVVRIAAARDRRSVRYDLTERGAAALRAAPAADFRAAAAALGPAETDRLARGLDALLRALLAARGGRAFGLCRECRFLEDRGAEGLHCRLLAAPILPGEEARICREQERAA